MVLSTFNHIAVDKQTRVRNALLHEFVEHPLAEAQVARIVQEAEIARGAFYKYFTDLTDAYNYTFAFVMGAVHRGVPEPARGGTPDDYVESIRRFIDAVDQQGFREFVAMYYQYDEGVVGVKPTPVLVGADGSRRWAVAVLCHQTVRDVILDRAHTDERLTQLHAALQNQCG